MRINPQLGRFIKSKPDPRPAPSNASEIRRGPAAAGTRGGKICGCPVAPTMHLVRFEDGACSSGGETKHGQDKVVVRKPGALHHVFDFKWKSSTGHMQSLASV